MNFEIQIAGLSELVDRFGRLPDVVHQNLVKTMGDVTRMVVQQAQDNIARMFNNPGKMQASISGKVEDNGGTVTGTVSASGLPYLAIHEYGGVVHTPEIFPVNAKALYWLAPAALGFSGGPKTQQGVFAMHARAHDTNIPERSYLRAALAQRRAEINAAFAGTVSFSA
jgi:phage gpG-like protein